MRSGLFVAFTVLLTLALQTACSPSGEHTPESVEETGVSEVHWGYQGHEGPEHWAELSPDFSLCRDGMEQSPIDLTDATPVEGTRLERSLGTEILTIEQRARVMDLVDNGHTIQVTNDVPLSLDIDDIRYELVQFHFPAPSEHTIDGEHRPLEAHFVHKSADGELAVVSLLAEEGEHSSPFDLIVGSLPSGPGDSRHLEDLQLDLNELRPLPQRYFRYEGSLTTPPCTEGVTWIVFAEPREMSPEQIEILASQLHDNFRPVQSLGDRVIG